MSGQVPLEDELTAYIDGELSELDQRRVQAALASDPKLQALERRMRAMVTAVEALPGLQPSQSLRRNVLNSLDAAPTLSERLQRWLRPSRLMPALGMAAAAALVLLVGRQGDSVGRVQDADAEQLFVAQNMEVLEDLELAGLESPEDLEVIADLNSLELKP